MSKLTNTFDDGCQAAASAYLMVVISFRFNYSGGSLAWVLILQIENIVNFCCLNIDYRVWFGLRWCKRQT